MDGLWRACTRERLGLVEELDELTIDFIEEEYTHGTEELFAA